MSGRFQTTWESGPPQVRLLRERPSRLPFAKPIYEPVRFEDWIVQRPVAATAAFARLLQAWDDNETASDGGPLVTATDASAVLHPAFVARLSDSEAESLGLPPATRASLNLRSSGLIHKPGFRIDTGWTRSGGMPVIARAEGGRLRHDGRTWRIPEPLFSTLAAVAEVNAAPDEPSRQIALGELKRVMGEEAATRISSDGVIERLRLAYASGFSLILSPSASGFDFDPVLFGRDRLDAAEEGASLDEERDSLLPPSLASGFARRFRAGDGRRRTYLLDDGSLLFIDPQLSLALGAVRDAQSSPPEARRAFAAAPERHIAEALRRDGDAAGDVARLFIETQQFSERVAGIDIWRKPVLPWITPKPNSWLPESFGLRIGEPPNDQMVTIPSERIGEAAEAAQQAVHEERATFTFDGEVIPATQATVAALVDLADIAAAAATAPPDGKEEVPPPPAASRYFLQVRDNLEDVAYAPLGPAPAEETWPPIDPPASLRSPPKPHQIDGFRWLVACWRAGMPGALLADDMGLGKTYQALAFLTWLRASASNPRPVLIVAPTGLLANWRAEIERHLAPEALGRVVGAYGAELSRARSGAARDIDTGASALDPASWAHAGIVLTTYETMRDYHLSFARQPFAVILYDEVQKLKNPAAQVTRAAKTLNARFQLALTGTPVENRLQDLWSILDVVHPGLLGSSKAFEDAYPPEPEPLRSLHDRLTNPQLGTPPVLLRRMKEDCLASLPAKQVRPLPASMPTRQAKAYELAIARALVVKGTGQRGRMLEVLHQLRGISLHPMSPDEAGGGDAAYFADSARLATLFTLLSGIAAQREKVLIFCESLAMQALLAAEVRQRFRLPHVVPRIHGGVSGDARQTLVNAFQSRGPGFDAMILSPKAGGVGLTLTAANHVVHLSRWWNPAVEDQATDRVYRIGQTRDVTVYLPQSIHPDPAIAPASFDLKLHELMERKRKLSRSLLAPEDDEGDTGALFDSVVVDGTTSEPPSPIHDKVSPSPLAATPSRSGTTLRLNPVHVAASPPSGAAEPEHERWPSRIVYEPDRPRDTTIFKEPLRNDPPREIIIIDPYAAAGHRARNALVDFIGMLLGDAARPDHVELVTYDGESIDKPPETSAEQRDQLQEKWRGRFGSDLPLQHRQRSKRQAADLHDREIRVITRSGRSLLWDLGRGVEGVMSTRHGCRVNFTELPTASTHTGAANPK